MDFIAICGFAFLIIYCAHATNLFATLLESSPLVMLGNWSYSVYLWHVPVYLAVMVGFAANHHPVSQLNPLSARLLLLATALAVVSSGGTALPVCRNTDTSQAPCDATSRLSAVRQAIAEWPLFALTGRLEST